MSSVPRTQGGLAYPGLFFRYFAIIALEICIDRIYNKHSMWPGCAMHVVASKLYNETLGHSNLGVDDTTGSGTQPDVVQ